MLNHSNNITFSVCALCMVYGELVITAGETAINIFAASWGNIQGQTNTHAYTLSDQSEQTGAVSEISKCLPVFTEIPWRMINSFGFFLHNFQPRLCFCLTLTHIGSMQCILCGTKAQFSAHNTGCISVPHVVHDGPPFSISEHLHTTFT